MQYEALFTPKHNGQLIIISKWLDLANMNKWSIILFNVICSALLPNQSTIKKVLKPTAYMYCSHISCFVDLTSRPRKQFINTIVN